MEKKKITIKHIPKVSTNKLYAGKHFSYRTQAKSEMYKVVRLQTKYVIEDPSEISYTFYWTGRVLDSDNNGIIAKMITDILTNGKDSYKDITKVSLSSRKSQEKYDYCEIEITESKIIIL